IWYGPDDARNVELRVPESLAQTTLNAEVLSALMLVQRAHPETTLNVHSSRSLLKKMFVNNLERWEDRGWVGVANKAPLQTLSAALKARVAPTNFITAQEDEREERGYSEARSLARTGSTKETPDLPILVVPEELQMKGAKLSKLTQAVAYAAIKEAKAKPVRKATDNKIKQVQAATKLNFDRLPLPAEIWRSIRHKDFTRQVRNFLWKSMHDAHRIGIFWKHMPECEEREICQFCGVTEDLEHILLKCDRPGQREIWQLAEELWLKKNPSWPSLSLGAILGCGLANFVDTKSHHLPGATRLYRILLSESMFLIWKIRNDCVINKGGVALSPTEIHNKWVYIINQRLDLDRTLTNHHRYGKQISIKPLLVLRTWESTLKDEDTLPDNWLRLPRVLVGTEPKRTKPTPPPLNRRGRNR
ncbi:ribonuclease H-like protein, partial [Mycena vitilis]